MSLNKIKRVLLAGTALVAVAAFSTPARAATATLTTDTTWASAGTHTSTVNDGTDAAAGDSVNTSGFALTVTNNQTALDSTTDGLNAFTIGAITDTTGTGSVTVTNGAADNLAVTIASVSQTATGSLTLTNTGFPTNINATTVTGAVTEGTITLTNMDSTTAAAVDLTVGGIVTLTGGSGITITAGTIAGANSVLTLNGAGANALVAVTLDDAGVIPTGLAELVIGGTAAQTISGTINGGGTGEGTLVVSNTSSVTFSSAIGSLDSLREIDAGQSLGTTTFGSTVDAATIKVGTGTVAFDNNVTGTVDFGGNNGTVTVASGMGITGAVENTAGSGGTLTFSGGTQVISGAVAGTGSALALVNAGQSGGTTTFDSTVNAATIKIGTGTVAFDGNVTGAVDFGGNAGTVTMASGTGITGSVDNSTGSGGTLTLSGGAQTISGAVGATGALTLVSAGQASGSTTFDGAVSATAIDIGAGTVAFGGNVTGAVNFGGSNGTVTVASGASITGAVNSTVSSSGTLTLLGGTQTVSGIVGGTNPLTLVNAGATGGASIFSSAVNAATLSIGAGSVTLGNGFTGTTANFAGNGTLNLAAGTTLAGAVTTSTAGTGNFNFAGNGTVTGTLGTGNVLNSLTVSGTGTTGTVTGNLTAANTTNVGGNTLTTTGGGTFTMGATQTLEAMITGAGTNGVVAAAGNATIAHGATLDISILSTYHPVIGTSETYNFVTSAGGSIDPAVTIEGAPLFTFTQVASGTDLSVTAVRDSIASVAATPNNATVAAALDTIASTGSAALTAIQSDLNAAPSKAALNNVLSSLTPTVDGGAQASALQVGAEIQDIADTRIGALRADDDTTGMAGGVSDNGVSLWAQGYGQTATQDERDFVPGYGATTWGGAVGVDTANLTESGIVGLMVNYGQASVTSSNANTTLTTVDNYGFDLYGTTSIFEQSFLEGQIGYGYNKITSDRHNVGAAGIDALGNTNSNQYDSRLEMGSDYVIGYGTTFTPDVAANYTYLNTNGYQESGSGANLSVAGNSQNNFDVGFGGKIAWNLKNQDGDLMKPTVHAGYSYAVIDDRVETTSTFEGAAAGTDPAFTTTGPSPERNRFNIGAGVTYLTMANWEMSANYNYEYRTDYTAQSGVIRLTSHF